MITLTSSSFVAAQPSPSELGWLSLLHQFTDGSTTRYTYDATGRKLRTEHRVMTTGVFNPGLDDGGTAVPDTGGIALPFPDDPGLAVGEGGLGAWPEMSVFEF